MDLRYIDLLGTVPRCVDVLRFVLNLIAASLRTALQRCALLSFVLQATVLHFDASNSFVRYVFASRSAA
eukprot:4211689-Pyramimonas_sp.AAC.1